MGIWIRIGHVIQNLPILAGIVKGGFWLFLDLVPLADCLRNRKSDIKNQKTENSFISPNFEFQISNIFG